MSRIGTAKGGSKEKAKPPPAQPPAVVTVDIIPGKFNENDWIAMIERDSGEDFVLDLIEEMLANTMDAIYKLYIDSQILPFTVLQAKQAMLHIIEWQYLARDEGEGTDASSWIPDEEPAAAVTDCWAKGSVPKMETSLHADTLQEAVDKEETQLEDDECWWIDSRVGESSVMVEEIVIQADSDEGKTNVAAGILKNVEEKGQAEKKRKPQSKKPKVLTISVAQQEKQVKSTSKEALPKQEKQRRWSVPKEQASVEKADIIKKHPDVLAHKCSEPITLTRLASSCASGSGTICEKRSVELFDYTKTVLTFRKLDADSLPTNRLDVKYELVEPEDEEVYCNTEVRGWGRTQKALPVRKSLNAENTVADKSSLRKKKSVMTAVPPGLLENIDIAHGVVITENGHTKRGPVKQHRRRTSGFEDHLKGLMPVSTNPRSQSISVSDILECKTPVVRPINDSTPLPPIGHASDVLL